MSETERLIIRKFHEMDHNDLYEYLSINETYIYEPGGPVTREQASDMCRQRAAGINFYAVELKNSGKMIGHLYFNQADPKEFFTWELGFIFNPLFQREGYCTEAAKEIVAYAFRQLGAHRVEAFCNPDNIASWRVLENCGMTREGFFKKKTFFRRDSEGKPLWHDAYAYGILDEDFFRSQSGS